MWSVCGASKTGTTEGRGKTDAASCRGETGTRTGEARGSETGSRKASTGEKVMFVCEGISGVKGIPSNF